MRTLLLLGLLLGGMTKAEAVKVLPCLQTTIFQISARGDGGGASVIASARVDHPAVFPKQAYTTATTTPYRMTCPTFTATATAHVLTMTGNMQAIWQHLKARNGDPGTLHFFFDSGYIYPEIQEEPFMAVVEASLVKGKLHFDADGLSSLFSTEVIGARVNGGALKPVWFQGNRSQVKYDPTDIVEIYAKRGEGTLNYPPQIRYLRIDFKHGVLTIRDDVPFPDK
ncbi:hypothetical protein MF271_19000 (plasmid) [Deinococcus sp. KNUC1210]|uniref:hypothetical protein n=1 Tax=Deinococcus sp. KNUC1210 TaxID=2917691 RepID=UPI001EF040DD|nr:hypothetical protein [Deinococcus sp. KNUC1210]ULH17410.1 hypothetical protein MF271_19000 [Deinococcus sp. KNUC1210]